MKITTSLIEATFISRQNRFTCLVNLPGGIESVYLPNSGRLDSVLFPGQPVFLAEKPSPFRKTQYDLVAAKLKDIYISVDSRVPADLLFQVLSQGDLPQFSSYPSIQREVTFGRSRLDFLLSKRSGRCFLEVKSCTLVKDGRAFFPDAPTQRGTRHLSTLTWARKEGYESAVVFIIQREDADSFSPNDAIDADFADALRAAKSQGVGIYAYRCKVNLKDIELAGQVPVFL